MNGLPTACAPGTSRVTSPISASRFPDAAGKFFYVWLDAPIGYLASFKQYCERTGADFDAYWKTDSQAEVYHFIGKDIIYFHALFWPAMLTGAGFRTPTAIFAHGFLTVNGQKMSKSRGTFIKARSYLDHLNPEYLRYYFAAKLGGGVDDLDLNLEDFTQRVNSDLVGKVVNIASRCAGFIMKNSTGDYRNVSARQICTRPLSRRVMKSRDFTRRASMAVQCREIMALADVANQYIDEQKPWVLAKQKGAEQQVQEICSVGLNLFRVLMTYLKPVLPAMAEQVRKLPESELAELGRHCRTAEGSSLSSQFKPLMTRVEPATVEAMVLASKEHLEETGQAASAASGPLADDPVAAPLL